uniref:Uncharacterized protein n=1 Tax=Bacteriophage sp. TaxID=38018 RepID=A0A8D9PEI7_9VIRU|nr:MAG TPA: hypothetical protein [Bacteriophage sp.]
MDKSLEIGKFLKKANHIKINLLYILDVHGDVFAIIF